jgi:sirohydrochlorin cobaltochelatase
MSSAYLLVTHGSRDLRPERAIAQLASLIRQKSHALIGTAALECMPLPLHEQIRQFSEDALAQGISHIQIVPLFLLPGVHVMEDIPEEVAKAQRLTRAKLTLTSHLGSHADVKALLARRLSSTRSTAWDARILLSHGSRRLDGNLPVEGLANQLGMLPAYWSVSPGLEVRVQELVQRGFQKIGIVPYFLFSGGITDAIAQSVQHLRVQFPTADLHLAAPLDVSDELADLVMSLMMSRVPT